MINNWQRSTHVTKGSDPTQVVTWTDGTITIVEFQQVYMVHDRRNRPEVTGAVVLAEILHVLLEDQFQAKLDEELTDDAFEADRLIYGGM